MEKEFNLSKKIFQDHVLKIDELTVKNVKKFIKLLKEENDRFFTNETIGIRTSLNKFINKLAGDKLI